MDFDKLTLADGTPSNEYRVRMLALDQAVRVSDEAPNQTVERAEAYLRFLVGGD